MGDKFLTQMVSKLTRGGAPLHLLLVNRKALVDDANVGNLIVLKNNKLLEF